MRKNIMRISPPYLLRAVFRPTTPPKSSAPRTILYLAEMCQDPNKSRIAGDSLDTWQVLCSSSSHQNDAMLLQIVPFPLDVCHQGLPGGEFYPGDFAFRRVWLFGFHYKDLR